MIKIGVLALQGGFSKHIEILNKISIKSIEVRSAKQLENIDGLILPGGESTTNIKLIQSNQLFSPILDFAQRKPIFGTCAGSILMGKTVSNFDFPPFKLIDIHVERNAYGRQIDSFFAEYSFQEKTISSMFIRAPKFSKIGNDLEILASFGNQPIIIRSSKHLITSCHPELTGETAIHQYFIKNFVNFRI